MSKQFEKMQKLAFGKVVAEESNELLTEATLRNKIKELVHSSLGEAKKKKKDVAPQDDTADVDLEMGAEEAPAEETPSDTMTPETPSDIDIDPKVKSVQDYLQKAYANAKELGDEKLMTQIGNTITMVVRNQVLGGQVAESLDELFGFGKKPTTQSDPAAVGKYRGMLSDIVKNHTDNTNDLKNFLAAIEGFSKSLKDTLGAKSLNEMEDEDDDDNHKKDAR